LRQQAFIANVEVLLAKPIPRLDCGGTPLIY
jgi:hypothetical protein